MSYQPVYGFPCVSDPNDFTPDHQSCTAVEIETHRIACANFGKPEFEPNKGCYVECSTDGQVMKHVARTSWGLGVNNVRICDGIDCGQPFPHVHCWECGGDFCDVCWAKHAEADEP